MMSETAGDKVTFISIPGAYKTGENVLVMYEVDSNFDTNTRDWVGVFSVGWSSNRDYYTFEWIQNEKGSPSKDTKTICQVKFSGSRLPPEDGHFYQFCYVTCNGVVKGASRPFQFTKTVSGEFVGDLDDLVEVKEDDSLLFLRTRHEAQLSELQKKVELLTAANQNVEASFVTVKTDRDELKDKYESVVHLVKPLQVQVTELKDKLASKDEQLEKMKRELEVTEKQFEASQKEVGLLQMTVVGKEEEGETSKKMIEQLNSRVEAMSASVRKLTKDKQDGERQIGELAERITILVDQNKTYAENEQSLRDKCNQLEQENRELLETAEIVNSRLKYKESQAAEMEEQTQVLKAQITSLEEEMNDIAAELEKEQEEKKKLVETARIKEQEANVAQENLCEVLGTVNEPRDLLNHQSSVENVDKSALEALQLAYNDVEMRWNNEHRYALKLKNKVAELEQRIKQCFQEFENKANENVELRKELKRSRTPSITEPKPSDSSGSEATILLLQREYERLELELQEFQLKHDQRIDEKNNLISELERELEDKNKEIEGRCTQEDAMRKTISSLTTERDQLATANIEMNHKLEKEKARNRHHKDALVTPSAPYNPTYPPTTTPYPPSGYVPSTHYVPRRVHTQQPTRSANGKQCPICSAMFPDRMLQPDFERHVNSHF